MKLKAFIVLAVFSLALSISLPAQAGLKISCSLFPVYDFTRAVTGTLAEVKLILKPGIEPHEFEPSPMDIKALNDSDVFIFTGSLMEHWADRISQTLTDTLIVDASEGLTFTGNDPHIWLDLAAAQRMVMNISQSLGRLDPNNSQAYTLNAESYCSQLADLDSKFMSLPKNKALIFAGEFSYGYFVRRYGVEYVSAYDGENEPGIKRMAEIIRHIHREQAKYILSDIPVTRITRSISEQTNTQILTFYSAHNVQDISQTFLEIMADNYTNTARIYHSA